MSTRPVRNKPWTWVPWAFCVTGNIVLGFLAVFPFVIFVVFLRATILDDLGWVDNVSSLRDNASIAAVIGIGGTALVLALFTGLNRLVRRHLFGAAWPYWIVSSILLLVPTVLVAMWPELWQNLKPY